MNSFASLGKRGGTCEIYHVHDKCHKLGMTFMIFSRECMTISKHQNSAWSNSILPMILEHLQSALTKSSYRDNMPLCPKYHQFSYTSRARQYLNKMVRYQKWGLKLPNRGRLPTMPSFGHTKLHSTFDHASPSWSPLHLHFFRRLFTI